ncbi:MAG: S8 family serine peptidase [Acidimicrobiales bacterium]
MSRSSRCLAVLVLGLLALSVGYGAAPVASQAGANDPVYEQGLQWGLQRIGAPSAWARGTGRGVTIAIVDSGADLGHQDLRDKVVGQVSCIGANGNPDRCSGSAQDDNGHGTHVSGIASATTGNRLGIAGVAPDARLLVVRVLANDCNATRCTASGTASDVAAGIRWAVAHGAKVINLSLGGGAVQAAVGCSFCDAIEEAWAQGAIAVVAAGNDSVLPSGFRDEPAVVVTATDRNDQRASYSNSSSGILAVARWPVAAPGGEGETEASDCATGGTPKGIISTYWQAGQSDMYACLAGTSMAAPHVSGALAVLLSAGHSPQSAIDRLTTTATDLGPPGRDDSFGFGLIDLAKAVGPADAPTPTASGSPTTRPPSSGVTGAAGSAPSAVSTTVPVAPGSTVPPVTIPDVSAAQPFETEPSDDEGPPAWLVVLALASLVVSGTGTGAAAWRLRAP